MPAPPNPDPDPNPPPATNAAGSLLLPWLPKYHKVKAGLDEVMWDDPIKPRATFAQTLEIDGREFRIFPLAGKSPHERQITLVTQEHYGWAMVDGNSMNASEPIPICHGDYILFRLRNQPQNDDVVVASRPTASGGFAHMVKRFRNAERDLASETDDTSAEYPPMPLGSRHQILGIVIAVAKPI
jgi:hypothetical protein